MSLKDQVFEVVEAATGYRCKNLPRKTKLIGRSLEIAIVISLLGKIFGAKQAAVGEWLGCKAANVCHLQNHKKAETDFVRSTLATCAIDLAVHRMEDCLRRKG